MDHGSDYYKWQFLRRNLIYQIQYDLINSIKEIGEHWQDQLIEELSRDLMNKFELEYLEDYRIESLEQNIFKTSYFVVEIGPYSLIDLNAIESPFGIMETYKDSINKPKELAVDKKSLFTITFDISSFKNKDEFIRFFDKYSKLIKTTKPSIKMTTKDELEALLFVYDEDMKRANRKNKDEGGEETSLTKIYKSLVSKNLVTNSKLQYSDEIKSYVQKRILKSKKFVSQPHKINISSSY